MRPIFLAFCCVLVTFCSSSSDLPGVAEPAPWDGDRIAITSLPSHFLSQWRKAENRAHCALMAPRSLGAGEGAKARSALFAGGRAIAYDTPTPRSAFGIAGAGVSAEGSTYCEWPHHRSWADGSPADFGGGTGPSQSAYLRVAGQQCLYNVWSQLGQDHLEYLPGELRFVDMGSE